MVVLASGNSRSWALGRKEYGVFLTGGSSWCSTWCSLDRIWENRLSSCSWQICAKESFPDKKPRRTSLLNSTKYLGVYIDEDLTWQNHIHYIINKLVKFCSIFYKLRSIVPPSILRKLYFALVHPHLIYGIEIYANTSEIPRSFDQA